MAHFGIFETSIGPLVLVAEDGKLCAIRFGMASERVQHAVEALHREMPQRAMIHDEDAVRGIADQVEKYLAGGCDALECELDLSSVTPFQARVLREVAKIPRGEVASYAEIARRIGRPTAYRAVGNAVGNNPLPVVIPCHRVVASGGRLGGYGMGMDGGLAIKRRLLALEGVVYT